MNNIDKKQFHEFAKDIGKLKAPPITEEDSKILKDQLVIERGDRSNYQVGKGKCLRN